MRETEVQVLNLLREWRDSGRLSEEVRKHTRSASEAGLSEAEIEQLLQSWIVQFPHRSGNWIGPGAALADLGSLLNGPRNRKQRFWSRVRRIAGWCIDHYVAVAGIVTVFATLFYGFAYTLFFQQLDITPEQAGLSPSLFLTRSALGGLGLTLAVALSLYAYILPAIPVREDPVASTEAGSGQKTALNAFFALLGSCYLALFAHLAHFASYNVLLSAAFPLITLVIISVRLRRPDSKLGLNLRPLEFSFDRYLAIFLAAALPAGLTIAAAVTILEAHFYGKKAQAGYAVRDPRVLGLPFLGVRAEPALIDWASGSPDHNFPICALYIDGADGASFLYDHRSGRTLNFQANAMGLELRDRAESCDAPLDQKAPTVRKLGPRTLKCYPGRWRAFLDPKFQYQWTWHGGIYFNHSPNPRLFRDKPAAFPRHLRCRVIASNPFGEDVALSTAFYSPLIQPRLARNEIAR